MFNSLKIRNAAVAAAATLCLIASFIDFFSGILTGSKLLTALAFPEALAFAALALLCSRLLYRAKADAGKKSGALSPNAAKSGSTLGVVPQKVPHGEVKHMEEKYHSLISIIENIESNEPFREILSFIYDSFSPYIPYSHIGVALVGDGGTTIRAAYGVSGPQHPQLARRLTGYKTDLAKTSLMRVLKSGRPRVINDLEIYLEGREVREYNRILLESGIRSSITFPLVKNGFPIGIIFFSSDKKNVYRAEHLDFLRTLAGSVMLSLEKNLLLDEMVVSSTLALATLAEERDNETGNHLLRMKRYVLLLSELLSQSGRFSERIDTDFISDLERFSPLHDIGKVAIGDSILLKPGRLTPAEFSVMKTHTTYGGKVLRLADENVRRLGHSVFGMGIEITEGHHERWDGGGYPYGRSGEDIPLSARIVAVADVLDALTSKRPYKDPYGFEASAAMIAGEAGSHFDPRIVDVFSSNLPAFKGVFSRFSSEDGIIDAVGLS